MFENDTKALLTWLEIWGSIQNIEVFTQCCAMATVLRFGAVDIDSLTHF